MCLQLLVGLPIMELTPKQVIFCCFIFMVLEKPLFDKGYAVGILGVETSINSRATTSVIKTLL